MALLPRGVQIGPLPSPSKHSRIGSMKHTPLPRREIKFPTKELVSANSLFLYILPPTPQHPFSIHPALSRESPSQVAQVRMAKAITWSFIWAKWGLVEGPHYTFLVLKACLFSMSTHGTGIFLEREKEVITTAESPLPPNTLTLQPRIGGCPCDQGPVPRSQQVYEDMVEEPGWGRFACGCVGAEPPAGFL